MKKQKFTSITFHAAAQKIIDIHLDEIPSFKLRTDAYTETKDGVISQDFWIQYSHNSYRICELEFCALENTPVKCLEKFEEKIKQILNIAIPEEIKELVDFELSY